MYYIYHIPGVKIGCSINPKVRVKKQGYSDYELLETHTDIKIASIREIELQKQYGFNEHGCSYVQTIKTANKAWKAPKNINQIKLNGSKGGKACVSKHGTEHFKKIGKLSNGFQTTKERYSKPIIVYKYSTMEFVGEYYSVKEAARQLNINHGNIHAVLGGKGIQRKGYTFRYA
jgi:NUMOD1 domain